ncbi:MAG: antibiotic ABC transporter ATP-binding protein [Melioribacteraceae bacterium]|nr:MAG: antibiotic ABC transporter ATP-binding protein [Melioribacteraceae bacterium]
MLKIHHIVKHFGRIAALKDINLEVARGEFFGLLGPNGAGKSTLMNIIVGYLKPDAGSVSVDDRMMVYESMEMRSNIGYVPQEIALYQELSAIDNLKIFGSIFELSGKKLQTKIDEVLELVQLSDRKKDTVKTFSGGMKRRLNLAASIMHNPPLILCDEPTVGVDPQSRNAIFDMLKHLNESGKTVVYTTHYMEEAERLCSRMAIIDNGTIITKGTLSQLLENLDQQKSVKLLKNISDEQLTQVKQIGNIIEHEFHFELIPDETHSKLSEIFSKIESININPEEIALTRASLEDVFLHMTGRSMRD